MIDSLKDLEKLFKVCRKLGITELKLGDIDFKLGDLPYEQQKVTHQDQYVDPLEGFPEGDLTNEQLAFYSSGGLPANDPFREPN